MKLIDKTVDLEGSRVLNMKTYETIVWQRRFMALATLLAWISVGLLMVALGTNKWAVLEFQNTQFHDVRVELGVWGEWRTVKTWSETNTEWIRHFPSPPEKILRLNDADLKHYYVAQAVIGVISVVLLVATNLLALYTFWHHRYMFKRLCAMLYVVTGVAVFVVIEVLTNSVDEWNKEVVQASQGAVWDFDMVMTLGYSTRLAQAVIVICGFCCVAFACGSHKQKGDHAATAEFEIEDRPIHIGR